MAEKRLQGVAAIEVMFATAKLAGRSAYLPYFPIGYPDYDESLAVIEALARTGVDGFEIGIPFSDPLADGPVVQAASQKALDNGTTLRKCLDAVRSLRERGVQQPMMMMGYMNPFMRYGVEAFVRDAKAAGADGLIVPDLPPEEGARFAEVCRAHGLALVFFLAPTSNSERIALVTQHARGFIYVVSLTGVTGVRTDLPPDLIEFVQRVRTLSGAVPLVLGFGISQPEHVQAVQKLVDGYIVGSALVRVGSDGADAVRALSERLMPSSAL